MQHVTRKACLDILDGVWLHGWGRAGEDCRPLPGPRQQDDCRDCQACVSPQSRLAARHTNKVGGLRGRMGGGAGAQQPGYPEKWRRRPADHPMFVSQATSADTIQRYSGPCQHQIHGAQPGFIFHY